MNYKVHSIVRVVNVVLPALVVAGALGGCTSVAPGMHFSSGEIPATPVATKNPIVKAITPELVLEEKKMLAQENLNSVTALVAANKAYTIDSGDVLSIIVWDHPELTGPQSNAPTDSFAAPGYQSISSTTVPSGFLVDHEGIVRFPYAGSLKFAGLTEAQAREELMRKLAGFIARPDVSLRVQSYRSKRIYVSGEVKTPGMAPINDIPMTLVEALNRAGGMLPTADQSRIVITRDGMSYPVNMMQLMQRGINPSSIMLNNGDVLSVASRDESKVFVSGEVMTPKALTMHNGRLTLNEALGEAGGINPISGDGKQVYVIRNGADAQPLVFHLNSRSPTELALAEDFELKPKDVVYVDATSLTTWSRVINQILPSAVSGALSSAATFRAVR